MSTNNLSQLLLRNPLLLKGKAPLLINLPPDSFIDEYLALFPDIEISYYSTNFEFFQAVDNSKSNKIKSYFSSEYKSETLHDLVIIAFPKCKAELAFTLAMLSDSLSEEATILVVGENKSGIKSLPKLSAGYISHCNKVDSARHCVLYAGISIKQDKTFNIEDWYKTYSLDVNDIALTVASLPGVFSQKELDTGTKLLLENLPSDLSGEVLDFACGAGVIACFIGRKFGSTSLTLTDVSALALTSAEKTIALNKLSGKCIASNSLSHIGGKYDHVVSNPPFHQGVKTNYQATESFLKSIKSKMKPSGSISIVANSFLKYQPIMEQAISKTSLIDKKNGFSIYLSRI